MKAIMYHYIREYDNSNKYFRCLQVDNFINQIDYFKGAYNFLTFNDLKNIINKKREVKDNDIILTFDDGLKDHYKYVLPVLLERKIFGIFYIPVGPYVLNKPLGVHIIHLLLGKYGGKQLLKYLLDNIKEEMIDERAIIEFKNTTYKYQDNDEATMSFKRILNYYLSYEYRDNIIEKIKGKFIKENINLIENIYMTIDEIRELREAGMIIGGHGIRHLVMSKLNNEQQEDEISKTFKFIEEVLGKQEIKTFCYPYGGFNTFNKRTEEILTKNEVEFTFNVEHRDITQKDIEERPQALPRYDCNTFMYGKN